jgi:LPXTG-motif cell wall-anchored protein
MSRTDFLSSLNLFTLIGVVVIVAIALMVFLRKRSNRHPLEGRRERNVGRDLDAGREAPDHSPRR